MIKNSISWVNSAAKTIEKKPKDLGFEPHLGICRLILLFLPQKYRGLTQNLTGQKTTPFHSLVITWDIPVHTETKALVVPTCSVKDQFFWSNEHKLSLIPCPTVLYPKWLFKKLYLENPKKGFLVWNSTARVCCSPLAPAPILCRWSRRTGSAPPLHSANRKHVLIRILLKMLDDTDPAAH
jgi:hypothetical protein